MPCTKFEALSPSSRMACAAFALVLCVATLSFVVVSFAAASAASDSPSARSKREPACAVALGPRPAVDAAVRRVATC